jgi:hypothetical protein
MFMAPPIAEAEGMRRTQADLATPLHGKEKRSSSCGSGRERRRPGATLAESLSCALGRRDVESRQIGRSPRQVNDRWAKTAPVSTRLSGAAPRSARRSRPTGDALPPPHSAN